MSGIPGKQPFSGIYLRRQANDWRVAILRVPEKVGLNALRTICANSWVIYLQKQLVLILPAVIPRIGSHLMLILMLDTLG